MRPAEWIVHPPWSSACCSSTARGRRRHRRCGPAGHRPAARAAPLGRRHGGTTRDLPSLLIAPDDRAPDRRHARPGARSRPPTGTCWLDRDIVAFASAASTATCRADLDPVHEASALVAPPRRHPPAVVPHRRRDVDGRLGAPLRRRHAGPARPGTVRRMTDTLATDSLGGLFHRAGTWADMDAWHEQVAQIRRYRSRAAGRRRRVRAVLGAHPPRRRAGGQPRQHPVAQHRRGRCSGPTRTGSALVASGMPAAGVARAPRRHGPPRPPGRHERLVQARGRPPPPAAHRRAGRPVRRPHARRSAVAATSPRTSPSRTRCG